MFRAKAIQWSYTLFFVLLVCSTVLKKVEANQETPTPNLQEELLGEKSPETPPSDKEDVVSPDGKRVAWRDKQDKQWAVRVNGEPVGNLYREVEQILFSPDSQHLAYTARKGKEWVAVLEGEEGPIFEEVSYLVFSPDSQHFAYRAGAMGRWVVVLDGKSTMRIIGKDKIQGIAYEEVGTSRFSRDGHHLAYRAKTRGKWLIVFDGQQGKAFDDVGDPGLSPDGQHLIYPAKWGKKWKMVLDGEEYGPEMKEPWLGIIKNRDGLVVREGLPWVGFDSKGQPYYFGRMEKRWAAIVGGQPGPEFDVIGWPFLFGPQDQRMVYAGAQIKSGGRQAAGQVVIDGELGPVCEGQPTASLGMALLVSAAGGRTAQYLPGVFPSLNARAHGVSSPVVSPDQMHIAYGARRGDDDYVVVLDGKVGESFNNIACGPEFAPDGTLVYVGKKGENVALVADGEHVSDFHWIDADCTHLSLQDEHIVHVVAQGPIHRVFVDGKPGKEYDAKTVTNYLTLVKDENLHLAFEVHGYRGDDQDASFVVLDDQAGKHYDQVMYDTLNFIDEKTVSYVARKERKFFRVTQSVP